MRNAKRWLAAMMSASMVLSSGGVATLASTMSAYAAEVETPDEVLDDELVEADEDFEEPDSEIVDEVADEIEADEEIVESEEAVEEEAEAEDEYVEEVVEEAEEEEFGLEAASVDAAMASATYTVDTSSIKIPTQNWTGSTLDLSGVDSLKTITVNGGKGNLLLYLGTDYELEVHDSEKPTDEENKASVTFKGIGNYAQDTLEGTVYFEVAEPQGTVTYEVKGLKEEFDFTGAPLSIEDVIDGVYLVKNGNTKIEYPEFTVSLGKKAENAGDTTDVTFKVGDWEKKVTVKVVKADLSKLTLTATNEIKEEYNTKPREPKIEGVTVENDTTTVGTLDAADFSVSYENNIEASDKAYAVIEAKSTCKNFTGKGKVKFEIDKYPLSQSDAFSVSAGATVTFNGKAQTPAVTGKAYIGSGVLDAIEIPASEYKIVPVNKNSTNKGKYKVTLEAAGKNLDTTNAPEVEAYEIVAASAKDVKVEQIKDIPAGTTTGEVEEGFTTYFKATLGDYELKAADYTVKVSAASGDLEEVGNKGTVKLTGIGNFKDSQDVPFTVVERPMVSEYTSTYEVPYNGQAQRPTAKTLTKDDKDPLTGKDDPKAKLNKDQFVAMSYSNNTDVTDAAVVEIEGKGTYEGQKAKVTFKITPKSLVGATATVTGIKEGSYLPGTEISGATVTLTEGKVALTDKDCTVKAENINNGYLESVTVTGKGNYTGTITVGGLKVASNGTSLSNATVTGDIPAGLSAYTPATIGEYVKVAIDGSEVAPKNGNVVNYEIKITSDVSDASKVKPGTTISVKILPKNENLAGSKEASLKVVPRDINDFKDDVNGIPKSVVYNGAEQKPEVTFGTLENVGTLAKDKDYKVSYADNKDAGTATVTIEGTGNYKNKIAKTFKIEKMAIDGKIKYTKPSVSDRQFAVGDAKDLSAQFKVYIEGDEDGKKYGLSASDYTIALDPAKQAVTADTDLARTPITYKLTVNKDSKNFTSAETVALSYNLEKKTVTAADMTVENNEFSLNDEISVAKLGKVTVKVDGTELRAKDYDLALEKLDGDAYAPFEKGKVESLDDKFNVVVNFKGNYIGTARKALAIGADSKTFDIKDVKLIAPSPANSVFNDYNIIEVQANYIGASNDINSGNLDTYCTVEYTDTKSGEKVYWPCTVGTYKATAVATKEYGGKTGESVEFTITPRKMTKGEFKDYADNKLRLTNVEFAGPETKAPIVEEYGLVDWDDEGKPEYGWQKAEYFEVASYDKEWDGEAEKGNATVRTKEGANVTYDGTADKKFYWEKGRISKDFYEIPDQDYTGSAVNPKFVVAKEGTDVDASWVKIKNYGGDTVNASEKTAYAYVEIEVPEDAKKYYGYDEGEIYFNIVDKNADAAKPVIEALKKIDDKSSAAECQAAVDEYNKLTPEQKAKVDADAAAKAGLEKANEKVKSEESEKAAQKEADPVAKQLKAVTDKTSAADAEKAVAAYNALSAAAKAKVDADPAAKAGLAKAQKIAKAAADKKAKDAEAKKNAAAANPVINQLKKITDNSSLSDAQAALAAYNKLTAAQKALVNKNAAAKAGLAKAKKIVDEAGKISAPAKVKIKKAKAGKKKIKVTWTKQKDADGFEIQVATNKKFTKNLKVVTVKKGTAGSKTIKKLKKGKKYYVRVRAFKNVKNGKVYGKFSKKKRSKKVK